MHVNPARSESTTEWSLFDDWREPFQTDTHKYSWIAVTELGDAYDRYERAIEVVVNARLAEWDRDLADYGGDPIRTDWAHLRPLRLTREEDWSDWLAFLLEISATGVTGSYLFGETDSDPDAYARPMKVEREVIVNPYRADLVISWIDGATTHVEIKVGDQNLVKTFATARKLQETFGSEIARWTDFILLLPVQKAEWDSLVERTDVDRRVRCITWQSVSIGLRRGLLADESIVWKSFACAFVGAIEQTLLQFSASRRRGVVTGTAEQQLLVLEEGRFHG